MPSLCCLCLYRLPPAQLRFLTTKTIIFSRIFRCFTTPYGSCLYSRDIRCKQAVKNQCTLSVGPDGFSRRSGPCDFGCSADCTQRFITQNTIQKLKAREHIFIFIMSSCFILQQKRGGLLRGPLFFSSNKKVTGFVFLRRFFKTFFCSRYFISTKSFWKNSNRIWHKGAQNFRVGRYFAKKHCCIKFSKQVMIEHMKTCMEK